MPKFAFKEFPDEILEIKGTKIFNNTKELPLTDTNPSYYLFRDKKLWVKKVGEKDFVYSNGKPFEISKEGILEESSKTSYWLAFIKIAIFAILAQLVVKLIFR